MAKGYKVVAPYGDHFCSCRMRKERGLPKWRNACHEYRIGVPTIPKKGYGPLAVFRTLKDAKRFANDWRVELPKNEVVFECVYNPSKRRYLQFKGMAPSYTNDGEGYPKGTSFATKVTILREVKDE